VLCTPEFLKIHISLTFESSECFQKICKMSSTVSRIGLHQERTMEKKSIIMILKKFMSKKIGYNQSYSHV
jgi:hypothetical protein